MNGQQALVSRRSFIKALLATTAVAATPKLLLVEQRKAELTGTIIGQTFYVKETLRICDVGVTIRDCTFIALPELGHNPLVEIASNRSVVADSHFERGYVSDAPLIHIKNLNKQPTTDLRFIS